MSAGDRDTLTDEERLEALKAWQDTWKDKGYPYPVPTASFLAGFDAAAARVRAAQTQALRDAATQIRTEANEANGKVPERYFSGLMDAAEFLDRSADRSDPGDEFQNPED